MTNEEAIKYLSGLRASINGVFDLYFRNQCAALDMAIKALESQPNRCDSCKHLKTQPFGTCSHCKHSYYDNWEEDKADDE